MTNPLGTSTLKPNYRLLLVPSINYASYLVSAASFPQRALMSVYYWNDRRSRRGFVCFYSAIFQLTSAKFQTFAYNSRTVECSYMKF